MATTTIPTTPWGEAPQCSVGGSAWNGAACEGLDWPSFMVYTPFLLGWAVLPALHYAPTAGAGPGAAGVSAPSDRPASEVAVQTDEEVSPVYDPVRDLRQGAAPQVPAVLASAGTDMN